MAVGAVCPARRILGLTPRQLRLAGSAFLPEPVDAATDQALAQYAMDAARQAGATYADVRIRGEQFMRIGLSADDVDGALFVGAGRGYGVRVLVDGVWGYAFGATVSKDRLAQAAQSAVLHARRERDAIHPTGSDRDGARVPLAPAEVVRATYESPMEIDPFTVPLRDQIAQLGSYNVIKQRVFGIALEQSLNEYAWQRVTTVFASTDGSLLTQRFVRAWPRVTTMCTGPTGASFDLDVPGLRPTTCGFEMALDPALPDRIKATGDEAMRWASIPYLDVDVGRYSVVMSGAATAACASAVLAAALEMDRLSGDEADAAGTSYLAPLAQTFDAVPPPFSPLVTLRATPTRAGVTSVRWDDDGVAPEPYTLIDHGHVLDAQTTRDTAPALAAWYGRRGQPMRSHGCATAETVDQMPVVAARELTILPSTTAATQDDLIGTVSNGLLAMGAGSVSAEPGLSSASRQGMLFVVKRGKVVGRAPNRTELMLRTRRLWNESLVALGDQRSMDVVQSVTHKGMPWHECTQACQAPAALFSNVDFVRPVT